MARKDALKRRVLEYDRLHNSDRQIKATERPSSQRTVCLDCRQTPLDHKHVNGCHHAEGRWMCNVTSADPCPSCGGKLVEVEL